MIPIFYYSHQMAVLILQYYIIYYMFLRSNTCNKTRAKHCLMVHGLSHDNCLMFRVYIEYNIYNIYNA